MTLPLLSILNGWLQFSPSAVVLLDSNHRVVLASQSTCKLLQASLDEMLGQDFLKFYAPEEQSKILDSWQDPHSRGDFYPTVVVRTDGLRCEVDTRDFRLPVDGQVFNSIVLVDVTEERRVLRRLSTLSQFASSLTYTGNLASTLAGVCEQVVENTEAVACSLVLLDKRTGKLEISGSYGLPLESRPLAQKALNSGLPFAPRQAVEIGQMVIERDLRARLLNEPTWRELCGPLVDKLETMGWNSVVSVPIQFRNTCLGALSGYYPHEGQLSQAETSFLRTLTDLAAVAIENARLVVECEEKAALEERQRLARELHDSVAQALYGIGLGLKTAEVQLQRSPCKALDPIQYCRNLVEGASKEMQALIFSLRPESLETEGLIRSLEQQAESLRSRHSLRVHFRCVPEPPLDGASRYALFRVATEAFHNIVKHARAEQVTLCVEQENGSCRLRIEDDGVGFDPNRDYPGHLGLRSMRERIEAVGGHYQIASEPRQGTRISAEVPCR